MNRKTIQVGLYEVNCSILAIGDKAYVIDPGAEAESITAQLEKLELTLSAVLLTHAHFDHIGAIPALQERFPDAKVCVHADDIKAFGHPMNQLPPDYPPVAQPRNLITSDSLDEIGGMEIIETPGHTPGGVCYYFAANGLLFAGDTLFAGSVGRTDLPGGDMATLMKSLERLARLPETTRVIPGHGPETTIAEELRSNPFLSIIRR